MTDRPRPRSLIESAQRQIRMQIAASGRTVTDLAQSLHVHRTTVSRALNQPTPDAVVRLEQIADELGVRLGAIVHESDEQPPADAPRS